MTKKKSLISQLRWRPATIADLESLAALENDFGADGFNKRQLRYLLVHSHHLALTAIENNSVAGYALFLLRNNSMNARLYSLIVGKSWQGKGIARELLNRSIKQLITAGYKTLSLEVRQDNDAAIRLYQSLGFRITGELENYYKNGDAGFRMHCLL